MNISGIFILFANWSDCVDRNDKVFTLLYKIVMHKKDAHPYEIQNTFVIIIINGLLTLFSICYYYAPRHRYVKNYTNQGNLQVGEKSSGLYL